MDYYKILGVRSNSSAANITSKFRALALQHHPDQNPDDQEGSRARFEEVKAAYDVLSDPERRAAYDATRPKASSRVKREEVDENGLQITRKKKVGKPKVARDLQSVFRAHIKGVNIEELKKPWMATKAFKLIETDMDLKAWVNQMLADRSRWLRPYTDVVPCPVIAVDTETIGLDTRIITHYAKVWHKSGQEVLEPRYEVKSEIAGVCLSPDGISGIYIPINHQDCLNVTRECAQYELQRLFDVSHLIFYNAKFDREVMRTTLGINFRDYPHYEDVQILNYVIDPKADLGDDTFASDSNGLKGLSKTKLNLEQIELSAFGKVKAEWKDPNDPEKKASLRVQYVPFTWVPTDVAVWYAAADAICTFLLWELLAPDAQKRKKPHQIDGKLLDALTWMERQRTLADTATHKRLVKWHQRTLDEFKLRLRKMAEESGWQNEYTVEGLLIEKSQFEVTSNHKLAKLLFTHKRMEVVKWTKADKPQPSTDADAMIDLRKKYPDDAFLKELEKFKEYVSLHPEKLAYDPVDKSMRVYIKQSRVAGGRLAAAGGEFDRDGGFNMNPQAIKSVGNNWWVSGNLLEPDLLTPAEVDEYPESALHPSCFRDEEEEKITGWEQTDIETDEYGVEERVVTVHERQYPDNFQALDEEDPAVNRVPVRVKTKVRKQAPGIIKNHIANLLGQTVCLVPSCTTCAEKHHIIQHDVKFDAHQILNLRQLFIAAPGWTYFTTDFANVEMRVAANVSGEPKYIDEFLKGSGDFHTLTASLVFAEFNLSTTSKERKKELRALAKIINFALQYGGTAYTIYANLKKEIPDITWEDALKHVNTYWAGVPVYKAYYDEKQKIAREQFTCETALGRVVNFKSAMAALKIHEPSPSEMDNFWKHAKLNKAYKKAVEKNDKEEALRLKVHMDALYNDRDTGVKNARDYNKFLGKIQRVSANIPSQGLAGDFMRLSMIYIFNFAAKEQPLVQSVFRLHNTVHDEIDYTVKNEYVPYVVPRLTRLMKLRKLHKARNWIVPLEVDTEYGSSWDVKNHTTGEKGKTQPKAWTGIKGMEEYVPETFAPGIVDNLLRALTSTKPGAVEKATGWLESNLHPRAFEMVEFAIKPKKEADRRSALIALLQLDEFWRIDETPDEESANMETLEQYEARRGLTAADRGFMPEMGYIGAVPLDKAIRPKLEILLPETEGLDDGAVTMSLDPAVEGETKLTLSPAVEPDEEEEPVDEEEPLPVFEPEPEPVIEQEPEQAEPSDLPPIEAYDDLFYEEPVRKTKVVEPEPEVEELDPWNRDNWADRNPNGLQIVKCITEPEFIAMYQSLGVGSKQVKVLMWGKEYPLVNVARTVIPEEFLL